MPVSHAEFLSSALKLIKNGAEMDFRNSASRAYYAAYHAAVPVGNSIGIPIDVEGGEHARLIEAFKRMTDMKYKSIAYMLRQCRDLRVVADYNLEEPFTESEAQTTIEQTKEIINKIEKL